MESEEYSLETLMDRCCDEIQSISRETVTFLSHLTCCFLSLSGFELDVVTLEVHGIYEEKNNGENLPDDTDYDYDTSDVSNYSFPSPIWKRKETWEVAIKSAAVAPVALIAIVGNAVVIRILLKARLTRNPINLFILNMSIADLLCALLFPWIILVYHLYQNFMLGAFICKTEGFVLITLMLVSVLSLTAISYDRLTAVVFPFKRRMDRRTAKMVIWAVWIIAIGCSCPLIFWRDYHERHWLNFHEKWCKEDFKKLKMYWLILISLLVWLPLIVLVISYTAIVVKLETLERRQKDHPAQVKLRSKVVRMFFIIVIFFSISWIPFSGYILTRNLVGTANILPSWLNPLFFVAHYLMFVNSAANPIIYGLKNDNLRREIRLALPKFLRQRKTCEISAVHQPQQHQQQRGRRASNLHGILKPSFEPTSKNYKPMGLMGRNGRISSSSYDDSSPANVISFERKNSALEDIGINVSATLTKLTFTD